MNFRDRLSMSLSVTRSGFLPRVEKRMAYEKFIRNAARDKLVEKNEILKTSFMPKYILQLCNFLSRHETNIAM